MLLLTYFLGEQQEQERRRVLIDTLLCLQKKSASSICRIAGVHQGNLSGFRRPNGSNLLSSELQDRLLAALGWSGGNPDRDFQHDWLIRDEEGLVALKWILLDRSTASSNIQPFAKPKVGGLDLHWGGNLSEGGAPCHITIGRYLKAPDGKDVTAMMNDLLGSDTRQKISRDREIGDKFEGVVATELLRKIFKEDRQGTLLHKTHGIFDHRVALELSNEVLDQMMLDWICQQARDVPESLGDRLSQIDVLRIGAEEFAPSAMTKTQMKRFVAKLSKQ